MKKSKEMSSIIILTTLAVLLAVLIMLSFAWGRYAISLKELFSTVLGLFAGEDQGAAAAIL